MLDKGEGTVLEDSVGTVNLEVHLCDVGMRIKSGPTDKAKAWQHV